MDFINDIQDEIAHELLFEFADNFTAPLTFSLWQHEVPFYRDEALQKLYKARNAKGVCKDGRHILALSWGSQGMGEVNAPPSDDWQKVPG